jgi:hypothetical protein
MTGHDLGSSKQNICNVYSLARGLSLDLHRPLWLDDTYLEYAAGLDDMVRPVIIPHMQRQRVHRYSADRSRRYVARWASSMVTHDLKPHSNCGIVWGPQGSNRLVAEPQRNLTFTVPHVQC